MWKKQPKPNTIKVMQYIGVDIVEIKRIRQAIELFDTRFLNRIYTPAELEFYHDKPQSLAARFAGKEAMIKALSCPGISLKDIEILSDNNGKPTVKLYNKAKDKAESLALTAMDISLSHSKEYAVACAVCLSSNT
jgi:holo-[acyl-carrier protein] synthase